MTIERHYRDALLCAALLGWLTASAATHAAITYETRALTGTDGPLGPGLGPGVFFSAFASYSPAINDAGKIAFRGSVTGLGINSTNDGGVWSEGLGSGLPLVAREGNQAPGTGAGVSFSSLGNPVLNDLGQTAFLSRVSGPGVSTFSNTGIWSNGGGSGLGLVARLGDQAPGADTGLTFSSFRNSSFDLDIPPLLNDLGQLAFRASVVGFGTGFSGIWSDRDGSGLALLARSDDQAPGLDVGVYLRELRLPPVINAAGQIGFVGRLNGSGVSVSNDFAIWSEGNGLGLNLLAREGSQAPGTAAGTQFTGFSAINPEVAPVLNDAGQAAFRGHFTAPGTNGTSGGGIWSEGGGSGLALVAKSGDQAPGTGPGVNFSIFGNPVINRTGHTAFWAILSGSGVDSTNDGGMWSERGGMSLRLVARAGDPAPGTDPGVVFGLGLSDPVLNSAGQIAIRNWLAGPGVDSTNQEGIWATDLDGNLHLVARTGDLFDVSNDPFITDLRTISRMSFATDSGGEDGRVRSFNDAGQLAFTLSFTDGSAGNFVANLGPTATIAGDYNDDGFVDAADYTVWRDSVGASAGTLPNDLAGGTIGPAQYDQWTQSYGGSIDASTTSVPESTAAMLVVLGSVAIRQHRARRFG